MKAKLKTVSRPLDVGEFSDGETYHSLEVQFGQPHLFSKIAFVDNVVIKLPSTRGYSDYLKYIKRERHDPDEIRSNEDIEKYSNYDKLLALYPEFRQTRDMCGADKTHYLLVHKLQCERLRKGSKVTLPETRFVMFGKPFLSVFTSWIPAIIQEKVPGAQLWDMYDEDKEEIHDEWKPYITKISEYLSPLVNSELSNHINWNIENFIFDKSTERLYYIDLKPSTMFSMRDNEHNLRGIREVFIV